MHALHRGGNEGVTAKAGPSGALGGLYAAWGTRPMIKPPPRLRYQIGAPGSTWAYQQSRARGFV